MAIVKNEIGDLDQISSIEKMVGFVRSAPTFTEQPKVIDGASDLLVALWGEDGRHARTATGVAQLPFGAAVQLELIMRM
ncbi:MAG: RidA family protein [Pyrinomonadaceae bacterium]|nr:RidA family protein [Pyrinomonadaceae bacterium]